MKKIIIYLLSIIAIVYLLMNGYHFVTNGCRNVSIGLGNISEMDTVLVEVYFDGKKQIASPIERRFGYDYFSFNAFPGKHTLKVVVNGRVIEKTISIFLMKFLLVDYHERSSSLLNEGVAKYFVITESSMPITIE